MYCSTEITQIFQDEPLEWRPSSFKLKGWTDTVTGYLYEANKLSRCLWENRRLMNHDYTWEVTINIEVELSPTEIKTTWTKICRGLRRKGVVALWVREPSPSNHCNYHLIVRNRIDKDDLESAIEHAMPSRTSVPHHKHVQSVQSQWFY